ncbi:peptide deformylase [Planctomicrobium sp. SH668]|uniref:peptide deformylase n=1 Tax=Planctomicrobium sp. SH668 TaxID=3448126 RepID=UPI003F5BF328
MQIVPYPHPALTFKSVDIAQIDATLRTTVRQMFDLMYEAKGIGLAANQVGLPFRFFVVNLQARPGNPDEEIVFINPLIRKKKGSELGEEGCLSLPGLYGDVRRATELTVDAFDLNGQPFTMTLKGLEARVVQHETDHLDGIMFTDRMRNEGTSSKVDQVIPRFVESYNQSRKAGVVAADEEIIADLKAMASSGKVAEEFLSRPKFDVAVPIIDEDDDEYDDYDDDYED